MDRDTGARRPLIAITTYREQARWGVWDVRADLLPSGYAQAVQDAGGVPVLLPPTAPRDQAAAGVAGRIDGLLLAGGADVAPMRYAAEPHPRTTSWREDRDAWELALLDEAERHALPVLGICRGMQVMAVQAGGVLEQHLPDRVGHDRHDPGGAAYGETRVRVQAGTLLHRLVGGQVDVHCHHHQAVRTHPGFVAVAWAEDGTVEAMERRGHWFCLGVQWHPEMAVDAGLFRGLVAAATHPAPP